VAGRVGWSVAAALIVLAVFVAKRRVETRGMGHSRSEPGKSPAPEQHVLVLLVPAFAMLVGASYGFNRQVVPSLGVLFDMVSVVTLLLYWRVQMLLPAAADEAVGRYVVMFSAGLAVFLSVMSFGPAYASNIHPLATYLMRLLLGVLPPLKSIREYDRIWAFGIL